ncbi:transcriptional regulator [Pseudomonas sp. rhizo66]|nr:transcriptional regulator [Pseudomonas sp. rhizo66]
MSQTLTIFDVAALLNSDEAISEYLSQVLADGDNEEFLRAIGYALKACAQPGHACDQSPVCLNVGQL